MNLPAAVPALRSGADAGAILDAIRTARSIDTTADPGCRSPERPAVGECEVSSSVVWEHVGGDLEPCAVMVDREHREHHDLHRIPTGDVVRTSEQIDGTGEIVELGVSSHDRIVGRLPSMRPEPAERLALGRASVDDAFGRC